MKKNLQAVRWLIVAATAGWLATAAAAQNKPAPAPAKQTQAAAAATASVQNITETQEQFLKLLRTSPVLTTVLARDPSLLGDQAYVARNNPELAQFLAAHPAVAQNPDFYLFSKVGPGRRDQALVRVVWPDMVPQQENTSTQDSMIVLWNDLVPMVVCTAFFGAIVWLVRLFMENRRWSRTFKLQSEIHGRLIDKFGSSQELVAYMSTEAGKRFLEAAQIPMGQETGGRMPNVLIRILTPLQAGIVLAMLGAGMLLVRHAGPDSDVPMLVLGTLVLMPGLGFILSAGITWTLANKLGLMPDGATGTKPLPEPFDPRNEQ